MTFIIERRKIIKFRHWRRNRRAQFQRNKREASSFSSQGIFIQITAKTLSHPRRL